MFKPKKDFEWNLLGIYNYNKPGKFSGYFDFLKKNLDKDGDLVEAGVYQGKSLLSVALFLKEMKSNKIIYGFDSFTGFPPIQKKQDKITNFKSMYNKRLISKTHFNEFETSINIIKKTKKKKLVDAYSISTSGAFADTSKQSILKKIDFLGLTNIRLIDGSFEDTMKKFNPKKGLISGIFDCDLYESYKICFNFLWPHLNKKGQIYLDEYYSLKFPGAKIACDEFVEMNNAKLFKYKNKNISDFERWGMLKI